MKVLYLVEGETEEALLDALNVYGRVEPINLWQTNIDKHLRKFNWAHIYVVYDTDRVENLQRFLDNLNKLIKQKQLKGICQQTLNLEDEMAYACGISKTKLFKAFNASSANEFKTLLLKTNNLKDKLT